MPPNGLPRPLRVQVAIWLILDGCANSKTWQDVIGTDERPVSTTTLSEWRNGKSRMAIDDVLHAARWLTANGQAEVTTAIMRLLAGETEHHAFPIHPAPAGSAESELLAAMAGSSRADAEIIDMLADGISDAEAPRAHAIASAQVQRWEKAANALGQQVACGPQGVLDISTRAPR